MLDVSDGAAPAPANAGEAAVVAVTHALQCILALMTANEHGVVDAWSHLLRQHTDAPLSVVEAVVTRRPDLAKSKKALLAACQQVHKEHAGASGGQSTGRAFGDGAASAGGRAATGKAMVVRWPF